MSAVSIENLCKKYYNKHSTKLALDNVSINIEYGDIYGLLGPNGAGKSTLINIMSYLTNKTSGKVIIDGYDIDKDINNAKYAIGIVPQELIMDPFFTVRETLDIYAGYYGISKKNNRTDEIIQAMRLEEQANSKPRHLSGGMKRRLLIAKALVHSPKILVLDEPTAGVDIELRNDLWEYVQTLNKEFNTTILLTTHYLEEAQQLCNKIAVLNRGKIISQDYKDNLITKFGSKTIVITWDRNISSLLQVQQLVASKGLSL